MSEISSLYSSRRTHYRKTGSNAAKNKHGDVKHIVFKEGKPLYTEIIRTKRDSDDHNPLNKQAESRQNKSANPEKREKRSSAEVFARKRKKLSERLKKAIQNSQTLWSQKEGIWISYQGRQGFLVKLFDLSDREISKQIMTQSQLLESSIPGLMDTSWEIV